MTGRSSRETFEITEEKPNMTPHSGKPESREEARSKLLEDIKEEVRKIFKTGGPDRHKLSRLLEKYKNDELIVNEINRYYEKRLEKRREKVAELVQKAFEKYQKGSMPLHSILDRIKIYKEKHKWSDLEYNEFYRRFFALIFGKGQVESFYSPEMIAAKSLISKTLGNYLYYYYTEYKDEGLKIKESEHPILAEILNMHENYQNVHNNVFLQSLIYEDCGIAAMSGEYKRDRHIASSYIHPIIACMFLPKFEIFDVHMLHSSFGNIVKCRYEKKPIVNDADMLLFYDITSDPNDVVCDIVSPITDIRNRFRVQISLWETVLKLRNGNYYEGSVANNLIRNLNLCRHNIYDNADLIFSQDEGSILRRLLSVFSLRPTIIYMKPITALSMLGSSPYASSLGFAPQVLAGLAQPIYTITSVPMLTINLPPYSEESNVQPIDLRVVTSQTIWINENKTIVPKEQSIMHSREVLIFYVNRRIQRIQIRSYLNPISFSQLPLTFSKFERLNTYPVNIPLQFTLKNSTEIFYLRSVVAVTETEIRSGDHSTYIITGCTGLIIGKKNLDLGIFEPKYYLYDPLGAAIPIPNPNGEGYITNKPISYIEPFFSTASETSGTVAQSFFDRASRTGTIFFYCKEKGYSEGEWINI